MNYYALLIGIVTGVYVVVRFRKTKLEDKRWVYPVLLATFPAYYWVFAIYASDYGALTYEVIVGLGFLLVALIAYRLNNALSLVLLAIGYFAHAGYDLIHNSFFNNPGTPVWWPEFCGSIDLLIAIYLMYLAMQLQTTNPEA